MASRASNLAGFSTSIQSVAPNNLVVGVITATSFVGDGSNLTNAGSTLSAGSGSQRVVLTSLTSGTMTTAATDADLSWDSSTNTLSATNVSIAGTLTYEDVTNVDSIGVITARSGVQVTGGNLLVGSATSTGTASQRLQVTGGGYVSGNLGIGTANPQTNLHVFTGDSTKGIRLQRFAGAYYSEIIHTDLPEGLAFKVGDGSTVTEKVRIVGSNGNLGIATTSPTSRLHVVGDALISGIVTASSYRGDGSQLTGISAGIGTEALTSSGIVTTLNLTKQDHKVTATGITTITVSGGTEGDSHTVRIVNSGIATVGFSTYFLFPSGSVPVLPTASGAISLISFTVHRVGTAGTQLLAGASPNFS